MYVPRWVPWYKSISKKLDSLSLNARLGLISSEIFLSLGWKSEHNFPLKTRVRPQNPGTLVLNCKKAELLVQDFLAGFPPNLSRSTKAANPKSRRVSIRKVHFLSTTKELLRSWVESKWMIAGSLPMLMLFFCERVHPRVENCKLIA